MEARRLAPQLSEFDAEVRASGRGSHALVVPRSVVAGITGRRVRAEVNGIAYEASLGTYGGKTFLGLRKQLLSDLGVIVGDQVHVRLESLPDEPAPHEPPAPTTCPELEAALHDDAPLAAAWSHLDDHVHDEYGRWVSIADVPEDRTARIARMRHRLVPGSPPPAHP